ncbi:hypothetical protein [Sphingopyxis sp.]|uniref:hypothetical protein n=1 Tax=Sphingopyxis sp. TaxID=1908224 RepID=UPI003BABC35A
MARKRKQTASRDVVQRRLVFALALAMAGLAAGGALGMLTVGGGLSGGLADDPSFAQLSANPDALVADGGVSAAPCLDCADSYGVGGRLRAEHDKRMSEPFRELGAVDMDMPTERADDDYRYGGRFPDPPALAVKAVPAMVVPVALPEDAATAPTAQQTGPDDPPEPSAPPK